jgi:hypothetical protein
MAILIRILVYTKYIQFSHRSSYELAIDDMSDDKSLQ